MDDLNPDFTPDTAESDGGKTEPSRPQEWRVSQKGLKFDLHANVWPLTSKNNLYLGPLREQLQAYPALLDGAIRTLAQYAEQRSTRTCIDLNRTIRQFLDFSPPTEDAIAVAAVVSFKEFTFRRDGHTGNGMNLVRPFLTRWHKLGYPGVSDDLVDRMKAWSLRNYERHARVNRREPNEGPLEPDEQRALQIGALAAYEEGRITTKSYTVYRLFDLTGRRPVQLIQLKWKDMDDSRHEDAKPSEPPRKLLLLKVPRVKGKRKWRKHFRSVPLTPDEWNLLLLLRVESTRRFDELLETTGLVLQEQDRQTIHADLPVFLSWKWVNRSLAAICNLVGQGKHGDAIALLREEAASDAWEMDRKGTQSYLDDVIDAANADNRAGEPLTAFPTRFRYTLIANLERLGCPPTVIAFNLDHDTLQSLPDYSKNGADRAARWSKATATKMERLASFYTIKVVDREADAIGGDDQENSRLLIANAEGGAKAQGGGSGWTLLTWSPRRGRLVNAWAADHAHNLPGAAPLIALDMYEHSYHMDFGAKAGAYVDAFMQNLSWTAAEATFTKLGA